MLLISSTPGLAGGALGVITLEDIIEVWYISTRFVSVVMLITTCRKSFRRRSSTKPIATRTTGANVAQSALPQPLSCEGARYSLPHYSPSLINYPLPHSIVERERRRADSVERGNGPNTERTPLLAGSRSNSLAPSRTNSYFGEGGVVVETSKTDLRSPEYGSIAEHEDVMTGNVKLSESPTQS